jgi:hypothetical protein
MLSLPSAAATYQVVMNEKFNDSKQQCGGFQISYFNSQDRS